MLNTIDLKVSEKVKGISDTNSEVYRLEDNDGNFYVKKIIYGINQSSLYQGIFERECNALYRLDNSKYIVKILTHSVEEINGANTGCIYMEHIDGKTLADIFDSDLLGNYDFKEKLKFVKQLLEAVKAAHDAEIIHRDINPNNIMIDCNNNIKVIDFGVCKIKELINNATAYRLGTDLYSAPEVCRGSSFATPQSDLYSVGTVMYFLFAGKQPPTDDNIKDCVDNDCCRSGNLDIEDYLVPVIKKLVSSDPKERYSSVEEVADALSPLFLRYVEKNYTAVMNIGKNFNVLKSKSLIKDDVNIWELNCLNEEYFSELYIGITKDKGSDERLYEFMGKKIILKCRYEEKYEYDLFTVVSVRIVDAKDRENSKKRFCKLSAKLDFIDPSKISEVEKNNCLEIKNIVDNHYELLESEKNINREFEKKFDMYNNYLEESRRIEESNALRFVYDARDKVDSIMKFRLTKESSGKREEIEKLVRETRFSYEQNKSGANKKLIYIGEYETFEENEKSGRVSLNIRLKNPNATLPASGQICLDYRENVVNIDRQSYAFSRVKRENNPYYNLKGILAGIISPGTSPLISESEFLNDDLNESQQKAVRIALGTDSIAIIQGPPGTGKTSVIIEIIRQILRGNKSNIRSKKILLISQSHAAVDKMLEDLYEFEPQLPTVVRIGRMEKLSPLVSERFCLDSIKENWKRDVRDNCRNLREKFCGDLGVTVEEFEKYFTELEKQHIKNDGLPKESDKPNQDIIHAFEDKTSNNIKLRKKLEIQKRWSDRLENCEDVEKYIIQSADIVAGTCTGFISNEYVRDMVFDYLIIDEAAKATLTELAVSLYGAKKAILVGDHKQLPPIFDNEIIDNMNMSIEERHKLSDGVFKLLYENFPDENKITLDCQYRMHPTIGTLISSTFYDNKVNNGVRKTDRIVGIKEYKDTAIEWISTSSLNTRFESRDGDSYINNIEVKIIEKKLQEFDKAAGTIGKRFKIGVITAYGSQKRALRSMINRNSYYNIEVEVDTVDAFQGGQREIIFYSTVRSNDKGNIGFLKYAERLNVSLSRAQSLLIITGDLEFFYVKRRGIGNFPVIIDYIKKSENCRITDWSKENEKYNK
ncbi:MAG: protein kinase [Oscillospiraceae bacterium]|nr:protein kinase [Oscillospiraceae bacterium]